MAEVYYEHKTNMLGKFFVQLIQLLNYILQIYFFFQLPWQKIIAISLENHKNWGSFTRNFGHVNEFRSPSISRNPKTYVYCLDRAKC